MLDCVTNNGSSLGGSGHKIHTHDGTHDERERGFWDRITHFSERARRMLQDAIDNVLYPHDFPEE